MADTVATDDDNFPDYKERRAPGWPLGERHPGSVLTDDGVRAIRRERAEGAKLRVVAARYGISMSAVSLVTRRKTWKHVQE